MRLSTRRRQEPADATSRLPVAPAPPLPPPHAADMASWPGQSGSYPETEPEDLRVIKHQQPFAMDSVETNGCDDEPIALSVSNHADAPKDSKTEKSTSKLYSSKSTKISRVGSTSNAVNSSRSRRKNEKGVSSNLVPRTALTSEGRRATRHVSVLATKSAGSQKSGGTPQITPAATVSNSNKKSGSSQPPTLVPEVQSTSSTAADAASSEIPRVTVSLKPTKRSHSSPIRSSPPLLASHKRSTKRSLVTVSSSLRKVPGPVIDLEPLSPRASKRMRLQHQPFQSPPPPTIIPAILRQPTPRTQDDKICVFQRGEFLAVRNENGSFFVCRTAQNVYKSSKRFKIQWMSDQEADTYIPDFYDQTDFECVLTNLRLKRVDKNKYKLPSEERQRTLNILQRALNVENGIDIAKFQVTTDGVDVSIVGKEDEVLLFQEQNMLAAQKDKTVQLRSKSRPSRVEQRPLAKATRSSDFGAKKVKTVSAKVKLRSQETVKVKLKKEGGKIIISNKTGKPVPKLRKIIERLHPNSNVTIYEKDPTFDMNLPVPYVSSSAHSKLLIRAIRLKDIRMLSSLLKDTQRVCSLNCPRCVDIPLTPLAYAVLEEDHRAIKALRFASKKKYANPPETLLEYQGTGRQNLIMLGHAVKAVQLSRGGREGNNAFLKDLSFYNDTYPEVDRFIIEEALRTGVSLETLSMLFATSDGKNQSSAWKTDAIFQHIVVAIRSGHHILGGQLVSEAVERGGYGFGILHKEVLIKDRQPLPKFKPVSVTKKAFGRSNGKASTSFISVNI